MSAADPPVRPPHPTSQSLRTLEELTASLVDGRPLPRNVRRNVRDHAANQKERTQLFMGVLGNHKMNRLMRLYKALDLGLEYMTDPEHLAALRDDPKELRRHVEALQGFERDDIDFLERLMSPASNTKHGFSPNLQQTFNTIFQVTPKDEPLPGEDVSATARRTIQSTMQAILNLAERGKLPEPAHTDEQEAREALLRRLMDESGDDASAAEAA